MRPPKKTHLEKGSVAPQCPNEAERLSALRRYGILETPAEPFFDHMTRLASLLLEAPISLVTLVDSDKQWFKSRQGLDIQHTSRDVAFCAHAILSDDLLVVPDARRDLRFANNPMVTGFPGIRFYAGAPLKTPDGFRLGTVCVIDKKPRRGLTAFQRRLLQSLAQTVMLELERRPARAEESALESEHFLRRILESEPGTVYVYDLSRQRNVYINPHWAETFGYSAEETQDMGSDLLPRIFHPHDLPAIAAHHESWRDNADATVRVIEYRVRDKDGQWRWLLSRETPFQRDTSGRVTQILGIAHDVTARKQAEKELRETEEQLRLFIEFAPAAIAMFEHDMRYIAASRRWCSDYGIKAADIIGLSHYEVFPDLPEHWKEIHRRCLAGATERCEADPWVRSDGGTEWVRWEVRPWRTSGGAIGGLIIFSEVITEQKRAEQERDELFRREQSARLEAESARAQLSTVLERVNDGFVGLDRDWRYTYINQKGAQLFRRRPEDLLGKNIWTEFPEGIDQPFARAYRHALATQQTVYLEGYYQPWDRWFENRIYPSADGLSIFYTEITERKQAEETLRKSKELLRELIDGLGPSMFVGLLTPAGIIMEANRPALEAAGLKLEDAVGKRVEETFWFSYSEPVMRQMREAVERAGRGLASRFDVTIRAAEGQLIPLDFSMQPVLDKTGKVIYLVPSAMVITERVRAFEALKESEQRLKELTSYLQSVREEERTRIAREIHDDLGQALTALKFDLSRLVQQAPNGDAMRPQVESMIGLVNSSVESVRRIASELRPALLDDLGLVAAIEWQAQEFLTRTGIAYSLNLDESAVLEREQATALFRIFQEAMTNVVRHAKASRLEATLQCKGDELVMEIADDGVGIGPEPLRQRHSLGLLGMRERAGALGASFAIAELPGQGTVVRVRLPLRAANGGTKK